MESSRALRTTKPVFGFEIRAQVSSERIALDARCHCHRSSWIVACGRPTDGKNGLDILANGSNHKQTDRIISKRIELEANGSELANGSE
jgi:hypothetical protein